MDTIDLHILNLLKENSRATASEISKKVNLSIPAVSERIKKLEENNIIEHYTIKLNREHMNLKLLAIVFVNLDHTEHISTFRSAIIEMNEVIECHHLAGNYDYMLKVLVKDTSELEYFLTYKLKMIRGIKNSHTHISLSTLKESLNR